METTKHYLATVRESSIGRVGLLLLVLALLIGMVGFLNQHGCLSLGETAGRFLQDFYANLSTELASIAITVLVIDAYYQHRETDREKRDLILQMGSPDNAFAREAARRLAVRGWLMDGSLHGENLRFANLGQAILFEASLRGVDLTKANLSGAYLEGADLSMARIWLADMSESVLEHADLTGAMLDGTDFSKANLLCADLGDAHLSEANLRGAYLRKANLSGAYLDGANLSSANLAGANLSGANLEGANLSGTNLEGANLSGVKVDFRGLIKAKLIESALLPEDLRFALQILPYLTGDDFEDGAMLYEISEQLDQGVPLSQILDRLDHGDLAEVAMTPHHGKQQPRGQAADETLRDIRQHAGLSQAALAEQVGVSRSTVSRWEREGKTPSTKIRAKVAELLGVDPWAESVQEVGE